MVLPELDNSDDPVGESCCALKRACDHAAPTSHYIAVMTSSEERTNPVEHPADDPEVLTDDEIGELTEAESEAESVLLLRH